MALDLKYSVALRNAQVGVIETTIVNPTMEIRSGAPPANCAAADTGSILATPTMPAAWLQAASGGAVTVEGGPWQDTSADASGTAGHFRIKSSGTCHMQGTVGTSASDMIVDNVVFSTGQTFSIQTFTITAGNA